MLHAEIDKIDTLDNIFVSYAFLQVLDEYIEIAFVTIEYVY